MSTSWSSGVGPPDGAPWWQIGPQEPVPILKGDNRGGLRFYGFNFRLVLGPCHTKDLKNGSSPCFHGTKHEVGDTKHNWSAWCQYNVTGWVNMLSQ